MYSSNSEIGALIIENMVVIEIHINYRIYSSNDERHTT